MTGDVDLARLGALIGDRTRAAMLMTLLAGRPMAASALADAVGASPSLASAHLRKLVEGGLVVVEPDGRRRMFRLANAVADAIETLLLLAPPGDVRSLRAAVRGTGLRRARMCYDHLAGALGVAVTEALVRRELLTETTEGYELTAPGARAMTAFGVGVERLERVNRPLTRRCMDWSERRSHVAGSLGAALAARLVELRWLRPVEASRVVHLTGTGRQGLRDWLGVEAPAAVAR